jgi:hypothetical protein
MCAAAAGPPIKPVNVSAIVNKLPVSVKIADPIAGLAFAGTSLDPRRIAV